MFGLRDFEGLKGFTLTTVTRSAAAVRFMNLVSRPPMFDGKAFLLLVEHTIRSIYQTTGIKANVFFNWNTISKQICQQ